MHLHIHLTFLACVWAVEERKVPAGRAADWMAAAAVFQWMQWMKVPQPMKMVGGVSPVSPVIGSQKGLKIELFFFRTCKSSSRTFPLSVRDGPRRDKKKSSSPNKYRTYGQGAPSVSHETGR
jgi:hypothetical protein